MKEDFLHYLWKFKKFDTLNLKTVNQEDVTIINTGNYLELAGPDFFNAQIKIGDQKWAGNVEIHLKTSDWYLHLHQKDPAYENVILHVVWEHDSDIYRKNNTEIPVLVLKQYVSSDTISNYNSLKSPKSWIYCEKQIAGLPNFVFRNWQERLFFERLERKSQIIFELLKETNQDWEAVLFYLLAKNFGLNINGNAFLQMAKSIPFSIIRKESFQLENLEALFFGSVGLLDTDKEDVYFKDLKFRYFYLLHKYNIEKVYTEPVQFFRHRPDNFPTIRLAQLAGLYHKHQNLFSKIIMLKSATEIYEVFGVTSGLYWQNHYQFDKETSKKSKSLSHNFIDLVVINTIVPIQFAYSKVKDESMAEDLISILDGISPEKNAVIEKFKFFGVSCESAFQTQSLLQLKSQYCDTNGCMKCAVGVELLKDTK